MLKASVLIAQVMIKLGVCTTKIKYSTHIFGQSKCLPFVFRGELHEIVTQLSSPDLLNACQSGVTQHD